MLYNRDELGGTCRDALVLITKEKEENKDHHCPA
jgi:hypothetical protein